jgi:serine/threonine protein kinase
MVCFSSVLITIVVLCTSSSGNGIWKLADFGLTSEMTTVRGYQNDWGSGTPTYRPPEILSHKDTVPTTRTDIWALGCIVYELTFGKKPFWSDPTADLVPFAFKQLTKLMRSGPLPISFNLDLSLDQSDRQNPEMPPTMWWSLTEERWLVEMRDKDMRFYDIAGFLGRTEVNVASRYFDLKPFFGGQAGVEEEKRYPHDGTFEASTSRDSELEPVTRAMSSLYLHVSWTSVTTVHAVEVLYEASSAITSLGKPTYGQSAGLSGCMVFLMRYNGAKTSPNRIRLG